MTSLLSIQRYKNFKQNLTFNLNWIDKQGSSLGVRGMWDRWHPSVEDGLQLGGDL